MTFDRAAWALSGNPRNNYVPSSQEEMTHDFQIEANPLMQNHNVVANPRITDLPWCDGASCRRFEVMIAGERIM